MNDDFKRKLDMFDKGEMTEEEKIEFEKEMDTQEKQWMKPSMDKNKQWKILRASKWKARIGTALTVIPILLLVMMVSSFVTNIYYHGFSTGLSEDYTRSQKLADVINFSQLITDPFADKYSIDTEVGTFFNMGITMELRKQVGKEFYTVGEMDVDFLFSKMGDVEKKYYGKDENSQVQFLHPSFLKEYPSESTSEWERLEMLPEGTVATAFITFDEIMSTEKVFEHFQGKDLDLIWFPVDIPNDRDNYYPISNIGFPNYPIFHSEDWTLTSRAEERSLFGSTITEGRSAPEYKEGDTEMLHKQFKKTLQFLKDYQKEFNQIQVMHNEIKLNHVISYLEKNEISHHGVVITGPTKEVLSLKEDDWIGAIHIDEVALWNWSN
ncbi:MULTISPECIES: anti sigma factor C-terminal domain-containing protein [unclassified Sutcliffiella]|uniref:anti-sigma factor n=1 Tax=unclassified Sutcliffiella TaxID=2837532 RepID=UPI0030CD0EF3